MGFLSTVSVPANLGRSIHKKCCVTLYPPVGLIRMPKWVRAACNSVSLSLRAHQRCTLCSAACQENKHRHYLKVGFLSSLLPWRLQSDMCNQPSTSSTDAGEVHYHQDNFVVLSYSCCAELSFSEPNAVLQMS